MTDNAARLVGIFLMLLAVWGGAFGMHIAEPWAYVPVYLTAAFSFSAGLMLTISGMVK